MNIMKMEETREPKKFLGIYFECCNVYGRIYENKEKTYYTGRCPRCMRPIRLKIGSDGTDARFFRAR